MRKIKTEKHKLKIHLVVNLKKNKVKFDLFERAKIRSVMSQSQQIVYDFKVKEIIEYCLKNKLTPPDFTLTSMSHLDFGVDGNQYGDFTKYGEANINSAIKTLMKTMKVFIKYLTQNLKQHNTYFCMSYL